MAVRRTTLERQAARKLRWLETVALRAPGLLQPATPGQALFHADQARLRYLIAANQVGKTRAGAKEAWWQCTGRHPYRPVHRRAGEMWVSVANWGRSYHAVCHKLMEVCPHHLVDWKRTTYLPDEQRFVGARVVMRDGYRMAFVSGRGGSTGAASGSIDALWCDEPPKRSRWSELLGRLRSTHGPAWLTLTPLDSEQDLSWLQLQLEGDPVQGIAPAAPWSRTRIPYSQENVPWLTAEQVEADIALVDPLEYGPRVLGEWEGAVPDRRFGNWAKHLIFDDQGFPGQVDEVRLGADWGEGAGRTIVVLVVRAGRRWWVLREWVAEAHALPSTIAKAIVAMLADWSITVHHVSWAGGDVNSAGLLGGGGKFSAFVERAIAEELGVQEPPLVFGVPAKKRGAPMAGEAAINHALGEQRFFVHESCVTVIRSLNRYRPGDEDLKHPIDAIRYATQDAMLADAAGHGSGRQFVLG